MFAHHADLTRDFHDFLMVCALAQWFGAAGAAGSHHRGSVPPRGGPPRAPAV